MFGNSLENLAKSTGDCKTQHSNKFPKFFKIFGNLRKILEIVPKGLKRPSSIFDFLFKSSENVRSHWKSSEVGKIESCRKVIKTIFRQFLKILGNLRKCSETLEKFSNISEVYKNAYSIPTLTPVD